MRRRGRTGIVNGAPLTGLTQAAGFPRANFPYLFPDDTPGELTTMASAAQIEANRRNAQKSHGPKTEKGKARVRCNALKHGMTTPSPPCPV